jgi:hypothetical protein
MFRNEARTPGWVPVQQVELGTERFATAYRLLLAYACVRPQSEQNSSLLTRGCMPAIRNRHRQSVEIIPLHESRSNVACLNIVPDVGGVTTPAPRVPAWKFHLRLPPASPPRKARRKKTTDHRLNQACQPCATLSSTSSFDRFSDARTAEDGSARGRGVN